MTQQAHLLIVEDDPSDAGLLGRALGRSGCGFTYDISQDLNEIRELLRTRRYSAVLSDHSLPGFTASEVLAAVEDSGLDLPVLIVSGAVGEDRAADLMREGASDFVLKGNLSRLIPALQRELRDAESRRHMLVSVERRVRSESLLRLVMELSGDSFWEWDLASDSLNWSGTFGTLCGDTQPLEPVVATWRDRIHPEDRNRVAAEISEVLEAGGSAWSGTYRFRADGDRWSLMMSRCYILNDHEGRPSRVIGAMSDISERESMLERQRVFTALADQASESIGVLDPETGRFVEFNRKAHFSLGYSAEEFARLSVFDIDCRFPRKELEDLLLETRTTEMLDLATRHRAKDGSIREVRIRSRPIVLQGRTLLASVWLDVTERMAIEAELRQAQKMELLGQLAGGVAHDFNNVLAAMRLQVELAQFGPISGQDFEAFVGGISQMVDRATSLTRRLLNLGRKCTLKPEEFNLDEAVDDLVSVCRRLIGSAIEIRRTRSEGLPMIHVDRSLMDQVFMNLLVNARDAMPKGGMLQIDTRVVEVNPDPVVPAGTWRGRSFVQVRITDTGCGMSKEVLARIHEPFYTTKEPGRGTGLGLSAVRRSLQEHGGWMLVESTEGVGSTFTIFLPLSSSGVLEPTPRRPRDGAPKVLLVLQDPQLRILAERILLRMGCTTVSCSDAEEAYAAWQAGRDTVDLAIVPESMASPRSGTSLHRIIQEGMPGLPVVLTVDSIDPTFTVPPPYSSAPRRLTMPFSIESLSELVAATLAGYELKRLR